jgi:phosphonate transport system ATP-binding protein
MAAGRLVLDGVPAKLTDPVARDIYGIEAGGALDNKVRTRGGRNTVPALGQSVA